MSRIRPVRAGADRGEQRRLAGQPLAADRRPSRGRAPRRRGRPPCGRWCGCGAGGVPRPGRRRWPGRTAGRRAPASRRSSGSYVAGVVEDPDPADVAHVVGAGVEVEAAEAQPALHRRELGELLGVHADGRVALGARLRRAAGAAQGAGEPPGRLLAQAVQAVVEHGHVLLLGLTVDIIGAVGQEPCPPGMKVPTNQDNATPARAEPVTARPAGPPRPAGPDGRPVGRGRRGVRRDPGAAVVVAPGGAVEPVARIRGRRSLGGPGTRRPPHRNADASHVAPGERARAPGVFPGRVGFRRRWVAAARRRAARAGRRDARGHARGTPHGRARATS